jgi:hypothetical protein
MHNTKNSSPTVTNCILWGNTHDEIYNYESSPTVTYSDVQGGTGEIWFGEGCIDTHPMFADAEGRLMAFSPCIDAGNDAAVPSNVTTDLDGNPRIQGVCVDMGAFESESTAIGLSGYVWMDASGDLGYSLNEHNILYFYSSAPVWYFNYATGGWSIEGPVDWIYVGWPFIYELDSGDSWFAWPPEDGLWVYHFSTGQWELLPRIIPW